MNRSDEMYVSFRLRSCCSTYCPTACMRCVLPEPHAAVDEQRVVRTRRRLGDRAARGVRELIRGADDERVEGVAGVQPGRPGPGRRGLLRVSSASGFLGARAARRGFRLRFRDEVDVSLGFCTSPIASVMTPE